jgi:hypothetical protein
MAQTAMLRRPRGNSSKVQDITRSRRQVKRREVARQSAAGLAPAPDFREARTVEESLQGLGAAA